MGNFMIHFFICNIFISIIIGVLLIMKKLFKPSLTSRMQYNLWFVLLGLLTVPFLPLQGIDKPFKHTSVMEAETAIQNAATNLSSGSENWINDFSIAVTRQDTSGLNMALFYIWLLGIFAMLLFMLKSYFRLRRIEHSALPLQNEEVRRLFADCKKELHIHKEISIYSTAYIKSPFTVGFVHPRIYLPIHFISDYNESDCRFMLLHELQHYKHGDALVNGIMNLVNIVYWFNPLIWYALKEMRNDREIACDSSVLNILNEQDYEAYGNTLINFAEKISLSVFPFASTMGGNIKQIRKRIINIASYQQKNHFQRVKGAFSCFLISCLLLGFAPLLSTNAANQDTYQLKENSNSISYVDLSSYFDAYDGCFVLLDSSTENWQIYNKDMAKTRISPDSTYKIYSALLALEQGYITPTSNDMKWNGQKYPFAEWNADQNLTSAFQYSVNWYFQTLDQQAGMETMEKFYNDIDYGNHDLSGGIYRFWAESSLKISPLEQVEMLQKLYENEFNFEEANIQAVKNALLLSSNGNCHLYGKTGTGNLNGENVNGWFIGYAETPDNTYFFATNLQGESSASGSVASEITLRILKDLNIY